MYDLLFEDQIEVFELLKEWDCHDLIFVSYRFLIQSGTNNSYISHNNVLYPVNIGCFYFHSSAFQDFCHCNPHEIFNIEPKCSSRTIEVFLDLLHCRIRQPELRDLDEVLELCRFLGCSSLCTLINERSANSIISLILRKQEEESFDFSFFEHVIIENLESYLLLADFGHVCHLSVVEYLVNLKADINAKEYSVEFFYLIGLLFIGLLDMVILVLLSI